MVCRANAGRLWQSGTDLYCKPLTPEVNDMYGSQCFVRGCLGDAKALLGKIGFCDVHLDRAAVIVERYDLTVNKLKGDMEMELRGIGGETGGDVRRGDT